MIIRQTTTIVFEYPQDYLQEQEWCKTKEDRWIHKGTDTLGAVYENQISYSIGATADRKTENSSGKPNNCEPKICDTCRYYNSNIPCGSTPSACKKADKFAEEFVDGLKKLKPQKWETPPKFEHKEFTTTCVSVPAWAVVDEPQYEMGMGTLKCDNCSEYGSFKCSKCDGEMYFKRLEPKDEPQTERSE